MTRGDIHRVRLPQARGHEQKGPRFAVIVQSDELLGLSTVLVAPTSRSARSATFRPEITLGGETTRILVEQIRAVNAQRLGSRAGRLSIAGMRALDDALELVLAL